LSSIFGIQPLQKKALYNQNSRVIKGFQAFLSAEGSLNMKPFDKLGHFWGRPRAFDEFFWGKVSAKWLNLVGFKVVKVGG